MNDINELIKELKDQNIPDKEAEELAFLSKNLSNLYNFERNNDSKIRFLQQNLSAKNKFISKQIFVAALLSLVLLLGFTSVVSAQKSLPGQPLYPVKKLSENILSALSPSFKGEILKRRSEEVKDLSGKDNSKDFYKAVRDYENELSKTQIINLEKIDESKKNLQEAQRTTSEENKEILENAIIQTQEKQEELEKGEVKGDRTRSIEEKVNNEQNQSRDSFKNAEDALD